MKSVIITGAVLAFISSISLASIIDVPAGQPTIQEGIDAAQPGDTVFVGDGTYTGDGNRDIDFRGKSITVRSKHGAEVTIIDCQGDSLNRHRGFIFHSQEDTLSVLDGFTIQGGFSPGYLLEDSCYYCAEKQLCVARREYNRIRRRRFGMFQILIPPDYQLRFRGKHSAIVWSWP